MSAVNNIFWPWLNAMLSTLYPLLPSIIENASVVKLSIKSMSATADVPKLNNFKLA